MTSCDDVTERGEAIVNQKPPPVPGIAGQGQWHKIKINVQDINLS